MKLYSTLMLMLGAFATFAQSQSPLQSKIDQQAAQVEGRVIEWRRWFHEHPELSNREVNTGARIAELLKSFGLEVKYPVAKTGVVALLRGAKPGPVVALRADIDALPISERNSLPFASKATTTFADRETGVMHACGHDGHMAILLGVAQVLSNMKASLSGTVKFIFQPAEEGAPVGEEGGAVLMIKEGVLENPKVDAIFGLHLQAMVPAGEINYKAGSFMAAVDGVTIDVQGRGAHGASPWDGVDPIVLSGQIVGALQTIISRQLDLTRGAAVLTIGTMHAGIRRNIIPENAIMEGTIRTFDSTMQREMHERIVRTATKVAESAGGRADVVIQKGYPAVINDATLAQWAGPSLVRSAGAKNVRITPAVTMAEDFSFFQEKIPGLFLFLGAYPEGHPDKPPVHHTADFMINEKVLVVGVRALSTLAIDYLEMKRKQ